MTLNAHFQDRESFAPASDYRLLPFRFGRLHDERYILTNDVGEYVLARRDELAAFVHRKMPTSSPLYRELKSRHFLFDDQSRVALDLLALKVRTRAAPVAEFTSLHIFVVTLRCDHSCHYCQVSRQTEDRENYDMQPGHADKALEFVFRSPAKNIKIEFQGGESLLNFKLIRYIVERATKLAAEHDRNMQFVIASNLTQMSDEILDFAKLHNIFFSTSLDGTEALHTAHRPLRNGNSYLSTIDGVNRIRERLGHDAVAALMTTTPESLPRVTEIIDEYVKNGFRSVFLRNLSPYGFAVRTSLVKRYDVNDWIEFYKRGLAHVLEINKNGYPLREELTSILLQKIFQPSGARYVDLQSPAGIAIAAIVYNYDGKVYASDEGRMLAEMGDTSFCLGSLDDDTFESVMLNDSLIGVLEDSMPESAPKCTDCPFLPYCGADPVFHRATQKDVVGHKAFSAFCKKQMAVLRHIITLLEDDPVARHIMMGWV